MIVATASALSNTGNKLTKKREKTKSFKIEADSNLRPSD
jgi:hypothetical protein